MNYLLKKDVNWSMLSQGFAVPVSQRAVFFSALKLELKRGEKRNIKIIIDGEEFDASISNMRILQKKYEGHGDIVRILYSKKSGLPEKLQSVFQNTLDRCIKERNKQNDLANQQSTVMNQEYLVLYTTTMKDVFVAECITHDDENEFLEQVNGISEDEYENEINNLKDDNATIIRKQMNVKIRKMDRKLIETLKKLHNYTCQICGYSFREKYGVDYAEAHHIIPFTQSMNNDPSNILILCPNHHRIIHKCNAMYDSINNVYMFDNGVIDRFVKYHTQSEEVT